MEVKELDEVVQTALFGLFSRAKDTKVIRLYNFSFKKRSHLAVLNIARLATSVFGFNVELNVGFFPYIFYSLKYKLRKWCKRSSSLEGIDTQQFVELIEDAAHKRGVLVDVYDAYYYTK